MIRQPYTLAAFFLGLLVPSVARADGVPLTSESGSVRKAVVFVGAERLASGGSLTTTDDRTWGPDHYPTGGTGVRGPWSWNDPTSTYPFRAPRLGVDVVAIRPLTIGIGGFWFASHGNNATDTDSYIKKIDTDAVVWGIAQRVGLLFCTANARFCFWPKVGITYGQVASRESLYALTKGGAPPVNVRYEYRSLALNLEPTAVVSILPHFGVTASALVDLSLAARRTGLDLSQATTLEPVTSDATTRQVAMSLGVLGWL